MNKSTDPIKPHEAVMRLAVERYAAGLTRPPFFADDGKTTLSNGNTAPRKLCGFFMPRVRASLATHQGANGGATTPVSRIGGQRLTRRNKPKVRPGTNKPGRFDTVVDAVARPIYPLRGGFGFDHSIDYEAIPMNPSSDLGTAPKSTPTPTEIQATISKLVSELFSVQSLLRLSHFTLETIASRDPARIEVDADDLARANAIALERLGVIVDLVDRVESAIDTFGPEPRQVSSKDATGVGHE